MRAWPADHSCRKVSSVPAGLMLAAGSVQLGLSACVTDQVLSVLLQAASAVHCMLCIIHQKQDRMWSCLAHVKIVCQ